MAKNPQEEKFQKAQDELNQKIEAIMGPTQSGEKPAENLPHDIKNEISEKPLSTAPEIPTQEKPVENEAPEETPKQADETPTNSNAEAQDDPKLDKAVDEIAASESDEILEVEDRQKALDEAPEPKKTLGQKIKNFFKSWWHNKKARNITIAALLLIIAGLATYPTTRYFMLNTVGVRSKASITILDNSTQQPLKNVQVTVHGQTGQTDDNGSVTLTKVKLGATDLEIKKRAFAPIERHIVIGWGSNPLGQQKLDPAGVQYTFVVTDFLSGKPVEKAEASSGESSAFSDENGKIVLTLDKNDLASDVTVSAKNYRDEKMALSDNNEVEQKVNMVPSHKHAFVSNRSGKFDVYKIDVDGKNEAIALAGTGSERDDMTLAPHPTKNLVAVVSTRDNQRNKDGFLLSTLNLVNLDDNKVKTLGTSERIQVIGWADSRFVYVQIAAGASASNPKRYRLMSYEPDKDETKELASANYFNDLVLVSNVIYYAPAAAYQNGTDVSLLRIKPDGSDKQVVLGKETWNIFRTNYDDLTFAAQQDWYKYDLANQNAPTKIVTPANPKTRIYIQNPSNKKSVWIDQRDGKGVLIIYDVDSKKETVLRTQSGLKYPVYWVSDNTLVYRINTEQETADYVLNIDGGDPKKIKDVSNTGGVDKWYYY